MNGSHFLKMRRSIWVPLLLLILGSLPIQADFSTGLGHAAARRAASAFGKATSQRAATPALPPCIPAKGDDWINTFPTPTYVQANPADCAELSYRTPTYNWPYLSGVSYQLTTTDPFGRTKTVSVPAGTNWYTSDSPLTPGRYSWSVKTSTNKTSLTRQFTILSEASGFFVPSPDEMVSRAIAVPHPRGFPRGTEKDALMAAIVGPRAAQMTNMLNRSRGQIGKSLPPEPPVGSYHGDVQNVTFAEEKIIKEALLCWKTLGRDDLLAEATRRVDHLLTWDPDGATSHENHDQANRAIVWALTNYYDWNFSALNAAKRAEILSNIKTRVQAAGTETRMFESLKNLSKYPYDSHGFATASRLSAIAAMLAGDLPEANVWLKSIAPVYINLHCPWGGEEGGFANGTSYGVWQSDDISNWQVLRWTIGVDLTQKGWSKSHGKFLAYFLPNGSPSHLFGDGAELTNSPVQSYGRAYVNHMDDPFYRWYANQFPMSSHILEMFSPANLTGAAFLPADMGPSILFSDIGWTAMHSSLTDTQRTSVYFKSSWYGSFSHSQADQNSFVLDSKGKRLLIDSGYYDDYASPHWTNWYKLTKAHNAITYDGGQGQSIAGHSNGDIDAKGKITQFDNSNPILDMVTGDATQAFKGALSKNIRSLAYLRSSDVVVVFDAVTSSAPRTWEWNLHSFNDMTVVSPTQVQITTGTASVCVDLYSPAGFNFSKNNIFSVDPSPASSYANQWHGRFSYDSPALQGSFAAVLRLNCTPHTVSVTPTGTDSWTAIIDGVTLSFDGTSVRRD